MIKTKVEQIHNRCAYAKERMFEVRDDIFDIARVYKIKFNETDYTVDDVVAMLLKKRGVARLAIIEMYTTFKVYEHEFEVMDDLKLYD